MGRLNEEVSPVVERLMSSLLGGATGGGTFSGASLVERVGAAEALTALSHRALDLKLISRGS